MAKDHLIYNMIQPRVFLWYIGDDGLQKQIRDTGQHKKKKNNKANERK